MYSRTRAAGRAAALAAGVTFLLTACGAGTDRTPTSNHDHEHAAASAPATRPSIAPAVSPPAEPGFSYADPGEVCRRFVTALYSADATKDAGPGDAFARAARYMSGSLAGQSAGAARDGRWEAWTQHRARMDTRVERHVDMHQMPDSSVRAGRAQKVTATPVGADGWRGWTESSLVYCDLRHDGHGWRVADYVVYAAGRP